MHVKKLTAVKKHMMTRSVLLKNLAMNVKKLTAVKKHMMTRSVLLKNLAMNVKKLTTEARRRGEIYENGITFTVNIECDDRLFELTAIPIMSMNVLCAFVPLWLKNI